MLQSYTTRYLYATLIASLINKFSEISVYRISYFIKQYFIHQAAMVNYCELFTHSICYLYTMYM